MKDLGKTSYASVEHCIYCGSTKNLRREHIVPFGLSGTAVLPKSTCDPCSKITGRFEQKVLRGPMRAVRVLRRLKSRKKHAGAPKTAALTVIKGGREQVVELPLKEYPILLHFPIFPPPAFLYPEGYTNGIRMTGLATIRFGPRPEAVLARIGANKIKVTQNYQYVPFARMIAKVAYSYAFAEGCMKFIYGTPFPLPAILGKRDEIGRWVGTLTKQFEAFKGLLHRIAVREDREKGLLMGEVQLFADSQAPSYGVILGRLK